LVDISLLLLSVASLVRAFDGDVKHFGKVLTEVMGCSSLNTSSGSRDESFNSGRVVSSGEFLLDRLDTGNNGDSE
jgi:hypothetical protein